ncbi:methyltransferase [Salinisphaera sp. LB1]|uniref:methyltransferase n=1 Tax=Salinisphaera sp. LB1 TaxID=2183911 RepID=UPI000D706A67|nr:methyltransferase [Salinisphaera sp. LB1]
MTTALVFLLCAVLLSAERVTYFLVWRYPHRFQHICRHRLPAALGAPIDVVQVLFRGFKVLQIGVFVFWCAWFADGLPIPTATLAPWLIGAAMIAAGMVLNFSVFAVLGKTGVFYGNKLGHDVPWREDFPFSLVPHPQYVGAVLAIWGVFLIMRFPHPDWFVLPLLETLYYVLGAHFEQ